MKQKHGRFYTLGYAAAVGAVCAAVLTAAHQFLGPYQVENANARNVRGVLEALGVPGAEGMSMEAASDLWAARVRQEQHGTMTLYQYMEGGKVAGYAVRFSGRGYTAPIKGFMGLEPDLKTIRKVVITYHAETPGLGGQVGSREFLAGFQAKQVDGLKLVRARRPLGPNEVDAITGATITSTKFQAILDETTRGIVQARPDDER